MDEKQFEEKLTLLDHLQSACTSCGLCSEGCATFQATGWEHESPRGRLKLAAQFLHGRIHPASPALSTFDRCLGCQACEPLCPHQVPYRQVREVVQELRRELHASPLSTMGRKEYRQWITLAWRMSHVWWRHYGAKWLTIPSVGCQSSGSFTKKRKCLRAGQSVLAVCCMQDLFQHDVIEQTLAFMQRIGSPLEVDCKQPCCGALFERLVEGGGETICYPKEQRRAVSLQNQTLIAFLKWLPSRTFFLSMGCYCFVSKHHSQVFDLYAWIETLLDEQKLILYFPESRDIYYQPYCRSQRGAQDVIWRLLQRIEGLTLREVAHPQACCGGYCGETLLHPQHAQALASQKISHLPDFSTLVVTSPDCWGLFKSHSASQHQHVTICYPIQLLAQAFIR